MQALRGFLETLGSEQNFQQISDSIRDLPQQIRRLSTTGQVDSGPVHRHGRVTGDHQYHFALHFEPRSEGGTLCQTGVLVASATTKSDGGQPLPITCHWRRRIGAHLMDIPGIHGSMYYSSADDIGMDIVCQALPPNGASFDGCQGRATGVLGPFELDPITRLSLENLISSGGSRFPVRHFRDQDDPHPRDLQIHVTQDYVKVVHPGAERGSEIISHYNADFPKAIIHPLDTCKFRLELGEEREKVYHFVALSRTSRDLIALLIRCFHARKYIATSLILSSLGQNPATPGAPLTALAKDRFDIHMLLGRLGRELDRTVGQLGKVEKVVRNAAQEKQQLQAQLRETIHSYTEAIEKLHQQLAHARGGTAAALSVQLHEARAQNSGLQLEHQEVKQRLTEEQTAAAELQRSAGDGREVVEALKTELAALKADLSALQGNKSEAKQLDHSRAEELRRFRRDVDVLNQEKEGLERINADAEKEKQDLIENFLYVKGCLDKLQMASINAPAASPEVERELANMRATYEKAVDERNRVAVKVEQIDREREKQKQQREAALERVMTANARLLEERDRFEKEKARVSQLYQQTMGTMGATAPPAASAASSASGYPATAGASSGDGAEAATLPLAPGAQTLSPDALRAELKQKTELLAKRESETESLRSRLRKLAMV